MTYEEPNVPVSIMNVLMDAVINRLSEEMIDNATDDIKAGLVRAGKLQADPTDTKITLLIHPGGRDFPHILNTQEGGPGMTAPDYEIGGGLPDRSFQGSVFTRKRLVVELELFYPREQYRQRAQLKANAVLSRAVWAIWSMNVPFEMDDFGEQATGQFQVLNHYIEESGGKGTFIWRGEIQVEFMTCITPV